MKVGFYSAKQYERSFFEEAAVKFNHELKFIPVRLTKDTVVLSKGCAAVCCFVTDKLDADIIKALNAQGVQLIALRSAGYDHVDLVVAKKLGVAVARVPAYSPQAIAEFSVGLLLMLSRKIGLAHDRVRRHDFSLEGQLGFNVNGRTIGVVGTGHIGAVFAKIMLGFGCKLLACDPEPDEACKKSGVTYTSMQELLQQSDIVSLHCPLGDKTYHLINKETLALMKNGAVLINTGRGALIDTVSIIDALKTGKLGALGIDVYEKEKPLFFEDHSSDIIQDDQFVRLQAFPNVIITGHQAYLSVEALAGITKTTLENISAFENGVSKNRL